MMEAQSIDCLERENAELRRRLQEAERTLAILRAMQAAAPVAPPDSAKWPGDESGASLIATQQALQQSEERFRLAAEAARALVYEVDLRSGNTAVVEGLERVVGFRPDAVPLSSAWWHSRIHPDDLARHQATISQALASGDHYRDEYRVQHASGQWIDVEDAGRILRDEAGQPVRLTGLIVDISERKRTEDSLRASEQRFRTLANTTPAIIWTADPTGAITFHNRRWLEYTGISPEDNVHDWPTLVLHPEDLPRCLEAWTKALQQGTDYAIEVRNRRHDGEYRWFLTRATPVRDASGQIREWCGSTTDIHDQKLVEQMLREAEHHKDEFLAVLAHELRNPLAPIRNAVQILRLIGPGEPALNEARDMIERQVNQLVRLVDDLLDLSRIARGKIQLQKARWDLGSIVQQAVETSRPLIQSRRHSLKLSLLPRPVQIEGDFTRLAQVVSNLLNNAAKYTDEGGTIWLTVEHVPGSAARRPEVVIRVRDSGRGIDRAALDRLFDLFFQVERNLDRADGGLGIGLSLVKNLTELHGGWVEASSEGRGKGSEFRVHLPCVADASRQCTDGESRFASVTGGGLRILVVDDNRDAAESMAMVLRLDGHEVMTAPDAQEGLALALRERPEVALLDIGLPGQDGYQLCRSLRAAGLNRTLIVALTGYGQEEDRRRSQEAGFDAHQVKPVNLQELRKLLSRQASLREPARSALR